MDKTDKKFMELGKIVSTQGIKGEVRVEPWSDTPDFLLQFKKVFLGNNRNDSSDCNDKTTIVVEGSRVMKNVVVMKLFGISTPDEANLLRGKVIYIEKSSVKLPKGSYFIQDLIGLRVIDSIDESYEYGVISEVSKTGANDVYHIKKEDKIYLIPAIKQVIIKTDIEKGVLIIKPIEGLFDDED